jgi:divalent metal cation (Fe/Co/Zn/Cd) transporter
MEIHRRQRRGVLLHVGVFGLPHAVAVFVGVGLCLRDVLHQYGGPGTAPSWAAAWFGTASLIIMIWLALARRWWQGGADALRAASPMWWAGLLAALVATGIAWAGLVRSIFHIHLSDGPAPAAALLVIAGLPLFSCAAHLLWLRRQSA